ncbi:MAG TPA: tannase/feruloyl esterase family alpha/beta hydrolase [Chthoniobacteraceae bacterium]|jgi:feruloyl esterase|nr:tannase/feruloyl esterase family alpha/beta hydrolase [Chthoniobacteraceae bacterium]
MPNPSASLNHKIAALCLAALFSGLAAHGQNPQGAGAPASVEERLVAVRGLKIDAGTISLVEHEVAPTLPGADARAPKNLPPRTVVKLLLQPAKGSNINVEIWLPEPVAWNSRLLGLGNGGSAGHISPGTLAGPMSGGYAAVTTDMGTAPNADSGVGNPEVWRDFGYRATHLMTVAAKQVVAAYYGKAPELSYFSGGSTGGQQALQEAQRYPEDYDGITAAVPAHCRTPLHAYFLWNDQILKKTAFTKSQSDHVVAAGTEYLAARETPPVAGKFVSDPRCDRKDIEAVVALALKKDPTLTPEHAEALRKLFDGPRHSVTGERIFNGIPFGASLEAAHGHLYLFKWVFGADKKTDDLNFGADIDTYTAALAPWLNAENPDLSAFEKRGGKLIITTGAADSVVPCHATLDYYERVIEHFGSLEKAKSFCLLYLIPGMAHGGGPGVQPPGLLELVRTWREKGTGPGALTGRRVVDGKTELEMPLYPYPTRTGWDAATSAFKPVDGPRGGVERVAERFRPPAK